MSLPQAPTTRPITDCSCDARPVDCPPCPPCPCKPSFAVLDVSGFDTPIVPGGRAARRTDPADAPLTPGWAPPPGVLMPAGSFAAQKGAILVNMPAPFRADVPWLGLSRHDAGVVGSAARDGVGFPPTRPADGSNRRRSGDRDFGAAQQHGFARETGSSSLPGWMLKTGGRQTVVSGDALPPDARRRNDTKDAQAAQQRVDSAHGEVSAGKRDAPGSLKGAGGALRAATARIPGADSASARSSEIQDKVRTKGGFVGNATEQAMFNRAAGSKGGMLGALTDDPFAPGSHDGGSSKGGDAAAAAAMAVRSKYAPSKLADMRAAEQNRQLDERISAATGKASGGQGGAASSDDARAAESEATNDPHRPASRRKPRGAVEMRRTATGRPPADAEPTPPRSTASDGSTLNVNTASAESHGTAQTAAAASPAAPNAGAAAAGTTAAPPRPPKSPTAPQAKQLGRFTGQTAAKPSSAAPSSSGSALGADGLNVSAGAGSPPPSAAPFAAQHTNDMDLATFAHPATGPVTPSESANPRTASARQLGRMGAVLAPPNGRGAEAQPPRLEPPRDVPPHDEPLKPGGPRATAAAAPDRPQSGFPTARGQWVEARSERAAPLVASGPASGASGVSRAAGSGASGRQSVLTPEDSAVSTVQATLAADPGLAPIVPGGSRVTSAPVLGGVQRETGFGRSGRPAATAPLPQDVHTPDPHTLRGGDAADEADDIHAPTQSAGSSTVGVPGAAMSQGSVVAQVAAPAAGSAAPGALPTPWPEQAWGGASDRLGGAGADPFANVASGGKGKGDNDPLAKVGADGGPLTPGVPMPSLRLVAEAVIETAAGVGGLALTDAKFQLPTSLLDVLGSVYAKAFESLRSSEWARYRKAEVQRLSQSLYTAARDRWIKDGRKPPKPTRDDARAAAEASFRDALDRVGAPIPGGGPGGASPNGGAAPVKSPCPPCGATPLPDIAAGDGLEPGEAPGGGTGSRGTFEVDLGPKPSSEPIGGASGTAWQSYSAPHVTTEPVQAGYGAVAPTPGSAVMMLRQKSGVLTASIGISPIGGIYAQQAPLGAPAQPPPAPAPAKPKAKKRKTKKELAAELLDEMLNQFLVKLFEAVGEFEVTPTVRAWLLLVLGPFLAKRAGLLADKEALRAGLDAIETDATPLQLDRLDVELEGLDLQVGALDLQLLTILRKRSDAIHTNLTADLSEKGFGALVAAMDSDGGDTLRDYISRNSMRLVIAAGDLEARDDELRARELNMPESTLARYAHRWLNMISHNSAIHEGMADIGRFSEEPILGLTEDEQEDETYKWDKYARKPSAWEQECVDDFNKYGAYYVFDKNFTRAFMVGLVIGTGGYAAVTAPALFSIGVGIDLAYQGTQSERTEVDVLEAINAGGLAVSFAEIQLAYVKATSAVSVQGGEEVASALRAAEAGGQRPLWRNPFRLPRYPWKVDPALTRPGATNLLTGKTTIGQGFTSQWAKYETLHHEFVHWILTPQGSSAPARYARLAKAIFRQNSAIARVGEEFLAEGWATWNPKAAWRLATKPIYRPTDFGLGDAVIAAGTAFGIHEALSDDE
ncbi:MAG: hypothetical protein K8T90_04070 [Planctomycetes bacterium]|nr:hypothetical protein [Planctomycetota bacterium]